MKTRQKFGGALLLGAAAAMCTTGTATAQCDSVLIYDNGFPVISVVVAAQVNDPAGLSPAASDDFTVADKTIINDIHWYTADDSVLGIGWAGGVRVEIYEDLGGCLGPDKANPVCVTDYFNGVNASVTRTIIDPAAVSLGAQVLDIVRYDLTKIDCKLPAAGTYWLSVSPISVAPAAPAESYWLSSRSVAGGDIVACGAYADPDDGNGWAQVDVGGAIDLNFQLTSCVVLCPWDIDGPAGSPDGVVNLFDLLLLLANWGSANAGANIVPDNIVNLFDLLDLLANWNLICPLISNDDMGLATLIIGTGSFAYDVTGATPDGPADTCIPNPLDDVWFCWKSECDGIVNVTDIDGANIGVYEMGNDCSAALGNLLTCVVPFGNGQFIAQAGQHYKFRVACSHGPGTFVIDDCVPSNDDCVDAIVLFTTPGNNSFTGDLLPMTGDAGLPACEAGPHNGPDTWANLGLTPGVWFVTVGDGSLYTVSTCGDIVAGATSVNADMLAVYCGSACDQLIDPCINRNSINICPTAPNARNSVEWCTVAGVIYFIYYAMDNAVDTPGAYTLVLATNNTPCVPTGFESGCPGIPGHVCAIEGPEDHMTPGAGCQLYDGTGNGAGGIVAGTSDSNTGFIIADNFALAAAGSLTTVCWYGVYLDFGAGADCSPGLGADNFTISLYLDDGGGVPDAAPFYVDNFGAMTLNVDKQFNDTFIGGIQLPVYEFTYTLAAPQALTAGTCYWIEIENTTAGSCAWLWNTAPPGDARSMQRPVANPSYSALDLNDFDMSFCLNLDLGDTAGICPISPDFVPVICFDGSNIDGYFQNPQNFGTGIISDEANNGTFANEVSNADNFVVDGAGDITGICWWGVYFLLPGFADCVVEPAAGSPFIITYWSSTAGGPGVPTLPDIVIGGPFTVTPVREDTLVMDFLTSDVYEYTAKHAPVAVADGAEVWVEIQHAGVAAETCLFLWIDAGAGIADGENAQSTDGGVTWLANGFDMAFRVSIAATAPLPSPPPANDDCVDAFDLTADLNTLTAVTLSNGGATPNDGTDDLDLPVGSPTCQWQGAPNSVHNTVWYTVTMPAGHTNLQIEACTALTGSLNDSTIAVFSGTCGALVEVGCGEDECGGGVAPWYSDTGFVAGLTPGVTYYICVMNPGGWGGSTPGTIDILLNSN